jgi:hypothetical protein
LICAAPFLPSSFLGRSRSIWCKGLGKEVGMAEGKDGVAPEGPETVL